MSVNQIYYHINQFLDGYISEGVKPEDLMNYVNSDEDNFKYLYNKIYKKLTLENIQFESEELTECLRDNLQDKIALMKDLNKA